MGRIGGGEATKRLQGGNVGSTDLIQVNESQLKSTEVKRDQENVSIFMYLFLFKTRLKIINEFKRHKL